MGFFVLLAGGAICFFCVGPVLHFLSERVTCHGGTLHVQGIPVHPRTLPAEAAFLIRATICHQIYGLRVGA